mmetsp:Transcript_38087/g.68889  ORF Transcript_38087/g.68889 Transcript_38087/m.68889 type:complete len:244 (+) Transcript_38087:868-1599(+)
MCTPTLLSYSTPTTSRPMPCTLGARPVAFSSASASCTTSAPSTSSTTRTAFQGAWYRPPSSDTSTRRIFAPSRISTPSRRIASLSTAAASWSSRGSSCGKASKHVTWAPNRRRLCAISSPMGPAPITATRGGSSVRLKKFAFVRCGAPTSPGMGTMAALAPVATIALSNRRVTSPLAPETRTVSGPANSACPRNTCSQKSREYRATESWSLIAARIRRIRAMTAPKSMVTSPSGSRTPNSADS